MFIVRPNRLDLNFLLGFLRILYKCIGKGIFGIVLLTLGVCLSKRISLKCTWLTGADDKYPFTRRHKYAIGSAFTIFSLKTLGFTDIIIFFCCFGEIQFLGKKGNGTCMVMLSSTCLWDNCFASILSKSSESLDEYKADKKPFVRAEVVMCKSMYVHI